MNIFDKTFMIIIDKIIYFINQIPVTILGLLMLIIVIGTGLSCAIRNGIQDILQMVTITGCKNYC